MLVKICELCGVVDHLEACDWQESDCCADCDKLCTAARDAAEDYRQALVDAWLEGAAVDGPPKLPPIRPVVTLGNCDEILGKIDDLIGGYRSDETGPKIEASNYPPVDAGTPDEWKKIGSDAGLVVVPGMHRGDTGSVTEGPPGQFHYHGPWPVGGGVEFTSRPAPHFDDAPAVPIESDTLHRIDCRAGRHSGADYAEKRTASRPDKPGH